MPPPNLPAALQGFVDDEMLRAPLLVDQVVDGGIDHLRKGMATMSPHERAVASDLLQAAVASRPRIAAAYVDSLRSQIAADRPGTSRPAPSPQTAAAGGLRLSLVDEDEVAVDVEISHTIEAIRSTCEFELRELQTFVSALVGDMDVSSDHNPFRAETHARALWAALQALPLARAYRLAFMRHAGMPLAQVLRKSYAAASSRLESMGIEPAAHRTLILPAGSRARRTQDTNFQPDLNRIRDSMPVPSAVAGAAAPPMPLEQALQHADAQLHRVAADDRGRVFDQQRAQLIQSAATKADQQLIEMFGRLFDAMLSDRQLAPDIRALLARLQASVLRLALRDAKTVDDREHAVWRFIDRVAFQGDMLPAPGSAARERGLRFVQGLIEQVAAEPVPSTDLYIWALGRLAGHEQHRLQTRIEAAEQDIVALQLLEDRLVDSAPVSTMHGTLDLPQMDTVPAELIDAGTAPRKDQSDAADWLARRRPGDWVRVFMQGRWVNAQLLWPGDRGELWLFADGGGDGTWAMRRRALLTLNAENLLDPLEPRSLLVDAAKRVMRRAARG